MQTQTEIVDGILRFPGQRNVCRYPGYVPKWVDLDEFGAALSQADEDEKQHLCDYATKFGLGQEMLRHAGQILSAHITERLTNEVEEFLTEENQ